MVKNPNMETSCFLLACSSNNLHLGLLALPVTFVLAQGSGTAFISASSRLNSRLACDAVSCMAKQHGLRVFFLHGPAPGQQTELQLMLKVTVVLKHVEKSVPDVKFPEVLKPWGKQCCLFMCKKKNAVWEILCTVLL